MTVRTAAELPHSPARGEQGHPAPERLVKSRDRVKAYGEVFTPRRMVDQMLDLVRPELETGPNFVDKTFFEPAAGDGNFLVAILQRKLVAIKRRYQSEFWPTESLFALASIYGVELLTDNHQAAQSALLTEFVAFHEANGTSCTRRTNLYQSAAYLISANIIAGNTLTGQDFSGAPIQFSWWNRVLNIPGTVHREPFSLASLRDEDAFDFTMYASYKPCRIEHVHKEVRTDA
ncbi:N-6 DNA methylase [Rarobacter faecitabidus]|uniref:N-6 DNA methylase n=1 Tax=Rarobacter faecitabidus TaxID=13243 RepID=A0A542ZDZ1_RARFA|nr:methylase [Rarobacter faecitabidus]TQL58565.1 hypothetical protein FB461_1980 [Rarobacter faecitabidus]